MNHSRVGHSTFSGSFLLDSHTSERAFGDEALREIFPEAEAFGPLGNATLRARLGTSVRVWDGLAQESQAQLFASDLLSLARSYEDTDLQPLAVRCYRWLQESDAVSEGVRQQAGERLELLAGAGPAGQQVERFLDHFVDEVTSPELLVGMGVGSLGWGVGRVLGLQGARALGMGGRLAGILSRGAGLGLEVTAFTSASLGISQWRHPEAVSFTRDYFQHWRSALLMVGVLRGTHWGTEALLGPMPNGAGLGQQLFYGGARHGATWVGLMASAYGHQWAGWSEAQPFERVAATALAQVVTFQAAGRLSGQIFGPHLGPLEQSLHQEALRLETPAWARAQGLAMAGAGAPAGVHDLMVFNMGNGEGGDGPGGSRGRGREPTLPFITEGPRPGADPRQVLGVLTIMRRISDPKYKFYERLLSRDITFEVDGPLTLQSSLNNLSSRLNTLWAHPDPDMIPIPLGRKVILLWEPSEQFPEGRRVDFVLRDNGFEMVEGTEAPASPAAEPAPKRISEQSHTSLPRFGTESVEHRSADMIQLIRHIMKDKPNFQERLINDHFVIYLESTFGWNPQGFLQVLNGLPRLEEIPEMRRINFSIGPKGDSFTAIKLNDFFVDPLRPTEIYRPRRTPETLPQADVVGPIPDHIQTPMRPPEGEGVVARPRETTASRSVAWTPEHLPQILHGLERLTLHMRLMAPSESTGQRPALILEGQGLSMETLSQSTQGPLEGMVEGREWDLWVPRNEGLSRVYRGRVENGSIVWRPGDSSRWDQTAGQALFQRPMVRSPLDVYFLLESYSRDPGRTPDTENILQHRGWFTAEYLSSLEAMMAHALPRLGIPGRRIRVVTEADQVLLEFENTGSRWRRTQMLGLSQGQVLNPHGEVPEESAVPEAAEAQAPASSEASGLVRPPSQPSAAVSPPSFFISRTSVDLLNQMRILLDPTSSVTHMDILHRFSRPVTDREVARYRSRLQDMPAGRSLTLWDTQGRRTLAFAREDGGVEFQATPWKPTTFNVPLLAESPLHLLQSLAMMPAEVQVPDGGLRVMARGQWAAGTLPPELLEGLGTFRDLPFDRMEIFWPAGASRKYLNRNFLREWEESASPHSEE